MLKKRIIPCLDIKDGKTVKGTNFTDLIFAGDPIALAKKYSSEGADEIVFLDITATIENRKTLYKLVERIAHKINIPFTVGGGINSLEDAKTLIKAGADKISINTAAVKNPTLISSIASELGSQCVVVAIDTNIINGDWYVYINGGSLITNLETIDWAKNVEKMGAGEILLTSINHDGTRNGFVLDIISNISNNVNIPVIASGGAGNRDHFNDVFQKTKASAALAAGIFHFDEISISKLKKYLKRKKIDIR